LFIPRRINTFAKISIMKLLTYAILFYLAYRFFIKPAMLGSPENEPNSKAKIKEKKKDDEDGEYIDYEEVD